MKAINISGQAPGGERIKLADILPLSTPLIIQFFPIYACNFTCNYCTFSIDFKKRGFISNKKIMDYNLFVKCIDEISQFPKKVKLIRFVGMGEPLLHINIAHMIKYVVDKNVTEKVEIVTNASLLTPKLSNDLISAGLSRLVISIQGTSKEKYKEISNVDLNFESFIENIRYFYEHKKKTHVYIKIIDLGLSDKKDENYFFQIFGDICDTIAIEHASPIYPGVNYNAILNNNDLTRTQFGLSIKDMNICPQPFFTLQINPDGNVVPCYSIVYPEIMGNCYKKTVYDIWVGKEFNEFRLKMLSGINSVCKTCKDCNIYKFRMFPEDDLTNDSERLKKFYNIY